MEDMEEFDANGISDDLNNWCFQSLEEVRRLFEKTIKRNKKTLLGKKNKVDLSKINRDKVIQKDDILNLKIMLSQIKTIDDLIKNI